MRILSSLGSTTRFAALAATLALAACSSGGCGNCTVPSYTAPLPGASPTPVVAPAQSPTPAPGVSPAPTIAPTPVVSPTPTITPTPTSALTCNQGAGSIPLGSALAPFAVLAGASINSAAGGPVFVTFDPQAITPAVPGLIGPVNDDLIGISPANTVTGFYPGSGTDADGPNAIYATNFNPNTTIPSNAQGGLTAAYNAAAAKASTATVAGDLATASVPGHPTGTLPPGVYTSGSTLSITSGNLTLDGGGNAQSVFVFQIGSSLTTVFGGAGAGNVLLTGNASACNIYWQVGSSATLNGATFNGNVFAFSAITVNGTTLHGRALARNAAVTFNPTATGTTVTNPGGQ